MDVVATMSTIFARFASPTTFLTVTQCKIHLQRRMPFRFLGLGRFGGFLRHSLQPRAFVGRCALPRIATLFVEEIPLIVARDVGATGVTGWDVFRQIKFAGTAMLAGEKAFGSTFDHLQARAYSSNSETE